MKNPDWGQTWIDQIVKFNSFQEAYKARFKEFLDNEYEAVKEYIADYAETISETAIKDAKRWPQYGNPAIEKKTDDILRALKRRISFLGNKWNIETNVSSGLYIRGDFNNCTVDDTKEFDFPNEGVYVYEGESFSGRFKIADYGWNEGVSALILTHPLQQLQAFMKVAYYID